MAGGTTKQAAYEYGYAARTGALFGFAKRKGWLSAAGSAGIEADAAGARTARFTATRRRAGMLRIDAKD
ncbi:hypothetical protein D0B32_18805 [Paraburkholderia sp. DHOC27]|nr:hypothetical protein D0B32_18805 [Paraburkholderia sp. DHOC27]